MNEAASVVELLTKLGTSAIVAAYLFWLLLKQIKRISKHVRHLRAEHKTINENLQKLGSDLTPLPRLDEDTDGGL